MKTFLTEAEKEQLRRTYAAAAEHLVGVFQFEQAERESALSVYTKNREYAIDCIDVTLGHLEPDAFAEVCKPENRAKLVRILERWGSIPQVDLSSAAKYIEIELGITQQDEEPGNQIVQRLDKAAERTEMTEQLVKIKDRFPFLFTGYQLDSLLTASKEAMQTIKPQFTFLNRLTLEDIAGGKIDFDMLKGLNRCYSPFSATLSTLADIEGMELPESHAFFPIVNANFPGSRRYEFKGFVEVIPQATFDALKSIDPRVYSFPEIGMNIFNTLTAFLLTKNGGYEVVLNWSQALKEGRYHLIKLLMGRNTVMNSLALLGIREDLYTDTERTRSIVLNPKAAVAEVIRKVAKGSYLQITESDIENAAYELTRTGFLVKFRAMRREQNFDSLDDLPKTRNAGIWMIDYLGRDTVYFPFMQVYMGQIDTDMQHILTEGPRKMAAGGRFYHQHQDFFRRLKEDPQKVDLLELIRVARGISEGMQDKDFKEFIKSTLEGINSTTPELADGITNTGVMHYVSIRNPNSILVEQIQRIQADNLLLGYAMNNCLKAMDILRYNSNPNSMLYCMWLNGLRVGMSYDLLVSRPDTATAGKPLKDPLIDSIELSDQYFEVMQKLITTKDGAKFQDHAMVMLFVNCYLSTRIQYSERGIYVSPESNNFHVRSAMEAFIEAYKGKRVLAYQGTRVHTDTDFKKMPYWIDRSNIAGKIETYTLDMGGRPADPGKQTRDPFLTEQANRDFDAQLATGLNGIPRKNGEPPRKLIK